MTKPHSDGFLQDMLTPMGLHNLSDVEKYRKLVAMRNQDIMDKREDQVLREYQHVTQGLTSDNARQRLTTVTGAAKSRTGPPPLLRIVPGRCRRRAFACTILCNQSSRCERRTAVRCSSARLARTLETRSCTPRDPETSGRSLLNLLLRSD